MTRRVFFFSILLHFSNFHIPRSQLTVTNSLFTSDKSGTQMVDFQVYPGTRNIKPKKICFKQVQQACSSNWLKNYFSLAVGTTKYQNLKPHFGYMYPIQHFCMHYNPMFMNFVYFLSFLKWIPYTFCKTELITLPTNPTRRSPDIVLYYLISSVNVMKFWNYTYSILYYYQVWKNSCLRRRVLNWP